MSNDLVVRQRPVSHRFHPTVFKIMAGLGACFVLAAWGFAGGGRTDLLLAVVTAVFALSLAVPAGLTFARRSWRPGYSNRSSSLPFSVWAAREVETSTGPVKGLVATIEVMVPIAAVALGMIAFALVLHAVI